MRGKFALALLGALSLLLLAFHGWPRSAEKPSPKAVIPHGQDRLPGPPLAPAEAVKKMTVPAGFTVEVVAAEPAIVNPVAMTFDERGPLDSGPGQRRPLTAPRQGSTRRETIHSVFGRLSKGTNW
jgi:hypothetical protein